MQVQLWNIGYGEKNKKLFSIVPAVLDTCSKTSSTLVGHGSVTTVSLLLVLLLVMVTFVFAKQKTTSAGWQMCLRTVLACALLVALVQGLTIVKFNGTDVARERDFVSPALEQGNATYGVQITGTCRETPCVFLLVGYEVFKLF